MRYPEWETINKDPEFLNWLHGVDDLTGYQRIAILKSHEKRFDGPKVANFFNTWKSLKGLNKEDQPKPPSKANPLEGQIVPGDGPTANQGTPPGPPPKRTVTPPEFQEASKKRVLGQISEKEFREIQIAFQNSLRGGSAAPT